MTQIGITGKKISRKLDSKIIEKGGLALIKMPILKSILARGEHESLAGEFGGYDSFINYNLFREEQHKKAKEDKRIRAIKRQQNKVAGRSNGDDFPSLEILLDSCGGFKS